MVVGGDEDVEAAGGDVFGVGIGCGEGGIAREGRPREGEFQVADGEVGRFDAVLDMHQEGGEIIMVVVVAVGAGVGEAVDAESVLRLRAVHHQVSDEDDRDGVLAEGEVFKGNPGPFDLCVQDGGRQQQQRRE